MGREKGGPDLAQGVEYLSCYVRFKRTCGILGTLVGIRPNIYPLESEAQLPEMNIDTYAGYHI